MTEREKVIKGLEYCAASCKGAWDENNGCPYMADFIKLGADHNGRCVDLLCEDALALLKAQEPHIVTIADYENNPNVDKDENLAVWRESRHLNGIAYHNDGWVILNRNRVEGWFNSEMIRFWTSCPTEAEREAVKWND